MSEDDLVYCSECGNEIDKLPHYWGDDPLCSECYENHMRGES